MVCSCVVRVLGCLCACDRTEPNRPNRILSGVVCVPPRRCFFSVPIGCLMCLCLFVIMLRVCVFVVMEGGACAHCHS